MDGRTMCLIAVLILMAAVLHVLETYRCYRLGFDEGYEKGLAAKEGGTNEETKQEA